MGKTYKMATLACESHYRDIKFLAVFAFLVHKPFKSFCLGGCGNSRQAKLVSDRGSELDIVVTLASRGKVSDNVRFIFATESKRIEQQGGYMFTNMAVPPTFNFGQ